MEHLNIIIGNVCSIFASVTDSISTTRKTARSVLWVQNASQVFYLVGALLLNAYTSAVQNVMSLIRNCVALAHINSKFVEWLLTISGVVFGIMFNNLGLIGYLPIIANLEYTLVVFHYKNNERALKFSFAIAVIMFTIYNVFIYNYAGAILNGVVFITSVVYLIRTAKKRESK